MSTHLVRPRPAGTRQRPLLGPLALIVLVLHAGCVGHAPRGNLPSGDHDQPLMPPSASKQLVTLTPSSNFAPVEVSDAEFRESFTRLVLAVPLPVTPRASRPLGGRLVRTSWQAPDARATDIERGYAHLCEQRGQRGDCFSFLGDGPHDTTLSHRDRFTLGLILALRPAMESAVGVLDDFSTQLMTAVCTGLAVYVLLLLFPDPVLSKGIGIAMTLFLWGYLGNELWGLISATKQLWNEAESATTFQELREASARYGRVLGPNTMRVLILLALWKAGAKGKESLKGGGLPGFPQAMRNAAEGGGIKLSTAAADAESVSVAEGELTVTLPSSSAAILASQEQGSSQEGDIHHIATVENMKSTARGGPWTPLFKRIFDRAGLSMEDPANKVRLPGHKGPHPEEYHQAVYRHLKDATDSCPNQQECARALRQALEELAAEILQGESRLHRLLIERAPR